MLLFKIKREGKRVRVEWKKAKAREEKRTEMRLSALIFLRRTRCYLLTGRSNNNALCMTPSNLPNRVQHTKEQHTSSSPPLYKRRKRESKTKKKREGAHRLQWIESLPSNITYESRCTAASGEHGLRAVALCFQFHFQTFPPTALLSLTFSNKRYRTTYLFLDGARHSCGTF